MMLYIKQRIFALGDKYDILDQNGDPHIHVESELFTFGSGIRLFDRKGRELHYIEQKLFRFMPVYKIYKDGSLCASMHRGFAFVYPRLTVESIYGHIEFKGDLYGMDFDILTDGKLAGSVRKKWFQLSDCYELNITDNADVAFFCALTIAMDNCLHNGKG